MLFSYLITFPSTHSHFYRIYDTTLTHTCTQAGDYTKTIYAHHGMRGTDLKPLYTGVEWTIGLEAEVTERQTSTNATNSTKHGNLSPSPPVVCVRLEGHIPNFEQPRRRVPVPIVSSS